MEVEIEMKWYEIKVAVSRFRSTTKSWNFFKTNKLSAIIWRYFEYPLLALIFPFILYTELCSKIKLLKKHIWKKQNKLQNFSTLTEQKTIRSVFLYFWTITKKLYFIKESSRLENYSKKENSVDSHSN